MKKIELKNLRGKVVYTHDCEDNTLAKTLAVGLNDVSVILENLDLRNADLRGLILIGTEARDIKFRGFNCQGANFEGCEFEKVLMVGNNNLDNTCFRNSSLVDIEFSGINAKNSDFTNSRINGTIRNCNFDGSCFDSCQIHADINNSSFVGASFKNIRKFFQIFNSDLTNADFSGSKRCYLSHCEL